METLNIILPYIITIVFAIVGAYVTVKISIVELKRDMINLKDNIDNLISSRQNDENDNKEAMSEMKVDIKAIFKTLTKIQIDVAKNIKR